MIGIGGLITVVFLFIGVVITGDIGRRDYERAATAAENVLASIDAEISRNFELYDLSLQGVIEGLRFPEIARIPAPLRQQILFDRAASAKYLGSIFVLDRNGELILDSRSETPVHTNHADREYFQIARDDSNGQMHLSAPWSTSEGDNLIAISRRLSDTDGSFRGVIVGTMRLSYFYSLFEKVKLRDGDRLVLGRTDGTIVMRMPFDYQEIGRNLAASPIFQRLKQDRAGSFEARAFVDGIERLYVYRHVGNSPLIVSYAQELQSVYAGWWTQVINLGAILALVSFMNISLIVFLARALKRGAIAEHSLAIAAMTDGLTGLCNRRRFEELYEKTWNDALPENRPLAVLMIDVDMFKSYNDQFGHQRGDEALTAIAACISDGARRGNDIVARYGGEEFIVLLSDTGPEQAVAIGEKIRATVLELRASQHGQVDATPTISIGAAAIAANNGMDRRELVKAADLALYLAKNNGRNRTELSSGLRLVDTAKVRAAAA